MDSDEDDLDGRTIALLGLVHVLLIVLGCTAVTVVLRFYGFPNNPTVRWNPLSVWLRERGWLLLLLPVLWTIYATIATSARTKLFSPGISAVFGVLIIALALVLFGYGAADPARHSLLIARPRADRPAEGTQTHRDERSASRHSRDPDRSTAGSH